MPGRWEAILCKWHYCIENKNTSLAWSLRGACVFLVDMPPCSRHVLLLQKSKTAKTAKKVLAVFDFSTSRSGKMLSGLIQASAISTQQVRSSRRRSVDRKHVFDLGMVAVPDRLLRYPWVGVFLGEVLRRGGGGSFTERSRSGGQHRGGKKRLKMAGTVLRCAWHVGHSAE